MKRLKFHRAIVAIAMMLIGWLPSLAHDFKVDDVFYNVISTTEVEVTYKGLSYDEFYYDEYNGSVVIPSSVKYNGVTYSVTSIGNCAFYNCTSLTSIEIPNSVTSIGDYAFRSCSSLTSIQIPNSVTSIGDNAFKDCYSLTSVVIGNSVTSIGNRAFDYCKRLTSVVIGNSVTSIRDCAFIRCESLTSIEIPNSVTSIGNYAFCECTSLTSIQIPNSVTSIGDYAFDECTSLTSIEIGNSVTSIGDSAFYKCKSLTSIVVDGGNTIYDSRNGCNAIIETASNTLITGCRNTIIPNSVTSIGYEAFAGCESLTSIEIPNSVISIRDRAFAYCESLTDVVIGNSVTSIGYSAFFNCYRLTDVVIGNSVTSIGYSAFENCSSLTSIQIPNSVTSIGDDAFSACSSLTSIEIPNSVTSIGDYTFWGCYSLTSIEIPNSVTSIGEYAFANCSKLTKIICWATTPPTIESDTFSDYSAYLYVPAGCKAVYDATEYWDEFTNIIELEPVLAEGATFEYEGLTYKVIVKAEELAVIASENGKYSGDIVIPSSVKYNGVTYSVTSIGDGAFSCCSSLTSIEIPNSVTNIGDNAFSACDSLTSIEIPNSVTSIGDDAFAYCESLTKITCLATNPPAIKSNTFSNYSAELYVPAGCISAYQSSNYWKYFNIKELPIILSTFIALNKTSASLKATETLTLVATVLPENATNKSVTWKSSNEAVATVDANGVVTAIALGEAVITATTTDGSDLSATCKVTVVPTLVVSIEVFRSPKQPKLFRNNQV